MLLPLLGVCRQSRHRLTSMLHSAMSQWQQQSVCEPGMAGYPTDKSPGTMWTDSCSLAIDGGNTTTNLAPTSCDAGSGQAGAPMYGSNNNIRAMLVGGNQGIENWAVKVRALWAVYAS